MRILVDLLGFTGQRGGTETYGRELCTRLPERLPDVELVAVTGRAGADGVRTFFPGPVRIATKVGPGPASWALGETLLVDRLARRVGADVVWSIANFGPLRAGVRRVVTVHDVIYREVPGSARERLTRAVTAWLTQRTAATADTVLTVSRTAAAGIHTHLGIPRERIRVIPNGSGEPGEADQTAEVRAEFGLPADRPLVLSTGNRMPHKNFVGLLRALREIPPPERPVTVIPGSHGHDPLSRVVAELGLTGDVILPGWVTKRQLEGLYAAADVYACPSLAEGFGLPVVDALRRGCRVVANDIPVLHEVGGDVTRYADAGDPAAFSAALRAALAERPTAQERASARIWAETFTWDRAADATAKALGEALARARAVRLS